MQEIKIPEGHKATILGGTIRIEPIEKELEPKFKRGDFIKLDCPNPYYAISIVDYIDDEGKIYVLASTGAICTVQIAENKDCYVGYLNESSNKYILANDSQIRFMLDGLNSLGKYWDAEALEIKDFIKVPESIGLYKWFGEEEKYKCGDNLFIGFNNDTQILGYDNANECYLVYPKRNGWQKVQCYLQPCKRDDLKSGDTAFYCDEAMDSPDDVTFACKVINNRQVVFDASNGLLIHNYQYDYWYKLIPINK